MKSREALEERDRELAESNSAETMDGAYDWQSNLSNQQILGVFLQMGFNNQPFLCPLPFLFVFITDIVRQL